MVTARGVQIGLIVLCLSAAWSGARAQEAPADGPDTGQRAPEPPGIHIVEVRAELRDDVYYLDADIDYVPSRQIGEALERGVPVPVLLTIEILRERQYLWNETVATLEQRYELDYHGLTRQYVIRNINIGTQTAYPSLEAALAALGRIVDLPLIDANLLDPDAVYGGRLQARIDVNALPVPLRLRALVTPEWRLASEWHEWRF